MKTLRKYVLSAFVAVVVSLTMANVTAMAWCQEVDENSSYTCYNTGEDDCYCYYDCYCHVGQDACDLALFRNGYSKVPDMQ
jgi:hypothetical protein